MNGEKFTYKWLILVTSVLCYALSWGILYAVGVLYVEWKSYFDSSASSVSFIGGLSTGTSCIAGPVFGFLLDNYGIRKCGVAGGVIMALGMSVSYFAESIFWLAITYGAIAGFGGGLSHFATCTVINDYFFRNRLLAEGVLGGGLGVGTFGLSMFQQFLSNLYTWKGTMLITGAICIHLSLAAMFFIPSNEINNHPLNFFKRFDEKKGLQKRGTNLKNKTDEASSETPSTDYKPSPMNKQCDKEKKGFFERSFLLWKNPVYLVLILSDILTWQAIFIPYVHLVERGRLEGMDVNTAAWLSSAIGLSSIIGRPLTGFAGNYFEFSPLWSYFATQLSLGIATFGSSFWTDEYGLFTFAVTFGFLSNGYGFLKTSVAYLLNPSCFADCFSWMLMLEGLGIISGPFLAGVIYDATKSYVWSFRYAGSLLILSAGVCFLVPIAEKYNEKRAKRIYRFQKEATSQV